MIAQLYGLKLNVDSLEYALSVGMLLFGIGFLYVILSKCSIWFLIN